MALQRIHHVAYRCKDALETVKWYEKYMGMTYQLAFAENQVPSTKEPDPYMHVFLDCGTESLNHCGSRKHRKSRKTWGRI